MDDIVMQHVTKNIFHHQVTKPRTVFKLFRAKAIGSIIQLYRAELTAELMFYLQNLLKEHKNNMQM